MTPLKALLLNVLITAFWPIIGNWGSRWYSGLLFTTAGLGLGSLFLGPWLIRRGKSRRLFSRGLAIPLFFMGLFSSLATAIYISALAFTTPANAAVMAQVEVIYSAILCAYFLKEPFRLSQSCASALVLAGTSLIMLRDLSTPRWKGDLMILATPWMYQVSHIFSKRLPQGLDPVEVSAGRVFYGFLCLLPLCGWHLAHGARWSWDPQALLALLAQGIALSCVNFVLWYRAILNMDLGKATTIILSYPALTVLFSWMLGQERIHGLQIVGLGLALTGAYWMSLLVLRAQKGLPPARRLPPEAAVDI